MEMQVNTIILSGGKSKRMGIDKALLFYKGKSFLEHLIEVSKSISQNQIIVSNELKHQIEGVEWVNDIYKDIGPLGGLYSGLKHSDTDWNFVLSCDTPFLKTENLNDLKQQISKQVKAIFYASENKTHFLIGLYHKSILPYIEQQIQEQQYSLKALFEKIEHQCIPVHQKESVNFTNINTLSDIKDLHLMRLKILFFGVTTDITAMDSMDLVTESQTLTELMKELFNKYPSLQNTPFQVALNQELTSKNQNISLKNDDVIALLPPFAGG